MKYERFEDLPVWQTAAELYQVVADLLEADDLRLSLGYRSQLERAAISISNNITEGFERNSTKELLNFLSFARASAGEVRSMISLVINRRSVAHHRSSLQKVGILGESCVRQITAWSLSIERSPIQGKRRILKSPDANDPDTKPPS
jgi:four helix bundle protein